MDHAQEDFNIIQNTMGATPTVKGTFFKLWAPHADAVYVTGSFNDWDHAKNPLSKSVDQEGHWEGFIAESKVGDEYKYILQTPSGALQKNDPYALKMTNSSGNSIVYDQHAFDWAEDHFNIPSWNELVIYELHIGTFNAPSKDQIGTFYTAIEKLDYLQELGVNAVELMPCTEFPGSYSWGYNPSNPFAIESDYGGPDGLKEFVKAAHQFGIAVILDVVYNHFGPSDLDMWQFDGWSENEGGGIYFYNDWRSETPWGNSRPDYGRNEVRQYIHDNALLWLNHYHIDGLRMDMVPYIRNVKADGNPGNDIEEGFSLLQWINQDIREQFPSRITIAEDMHSLDSITNLVEYGGLGYGTQWDANFVHKVRKAIIAQFDEERDMNEIEDAILHRYNDDCFQRVIYTESHDEIANGQARVAEEIADGDVNNWYSKKRASLGVILVMTTPGIPMIFQGQPLLEDKWFSDTDPIDWSRLQKFNGYIMLHKDIIQLRRNTANQTRGLQGQGVQIIRKDQDKKIIVLHRWQDGGPLDSVLIVLNFSDTNIDNYAFGVPREGHWAIRFNSDSNLYDPHFANGGSSSLDTYVAENDGFDLSISVDIPAYTALIFSQDT